MKIEWNKVTWYSKALAVIVFIVTLWLGFYFGRQYEKIKQQNLERNQQVRTTSRQTAVAPTTNTIDTNDWQTYHSDLYGFEFLYPSDLGSVSANGPVAEMINHSPKNIRLGRDNDIGNFFVNLQSRKDAIQEDANTRQRALECKPDEEEGMERCLTKEDAVNLSIWDNDSAFLDAAHIGDDCKNSWALPCRIIMINGLKAREQYVGWCAEGCSTIKTVVFYKNDIRYELQFVLSDIDSLDSKGIEKTEQTDTRVKELNMIIKSFKFR